MGEARAHQVGRRVVWEKAGFYVFSYFSVQGVGTHREVSSRRMRGSCLERNHWGGAGLGMSGRVETPRPVLEFWSKSGEASSPP